MRMGVQGASTAGAQHLEAHRAAMQGALTDATRLVSTASHTGKQQCSDGVFPFHAMRTDLTKSRVSRDT